MSDEKINDVELSCNGIDLMVNNDWDGCEKLFAQHKDHSALTHYCHSFISYMRAIMTFEDQLLDKAQKDIEATEKLCTESTKMFSSLKKALKLSSSSNSNSQQSLKGTETMSKDQILEDKFTKAIILADCKLYSAILTFVRQDVSAYFGNGILQIRKSWKMYAKIQKQLYDIYRKLEPNAEQIYGSDPNANVIKIWIEENDENELKQTSGGGSNDKNNNVNDDQLNQVVNELIITDDDAKEGGMSLETTKRLLGAVSFGYGLFQICLSFMPPSILKLIKVFGFEGDRSVALKAINFTSNSRDMRAPFADMVLLWYSTIATPLFGISEADLVISNDDTKLILDKNLSKYPKSSLFLYLKGKFCRSLMHDLPGSLECYAQALHNASHIREIQMISIYEIGWIHLCHLDYAKALENFQILQKESRWSKSFSTYICAILAGCMQNYSQANQYFKDALKIFATQSKKNSPIEQFANKRNEYFKKNPVKTKALCELLVVELLYLWVNFPYCEENNLKKMLDICDQINDKNFVALKCLYEGAINMCLNNREFGEQCFNESIARCESVKTMPFGKYTPPCAHYELALYYTGEKDYEQAKAFLNKAQNNYKDYELDNRIQVQIRSLQRKIKFITEGTKEPAAAKVIPQPSEEEIQKQKNFFIS